MRASSCIFDHESSALIAVEIGGVQAQRCPICQTLYLDGSDPLGLDTANTGQTVQLPPRPEIGPFAKMVAQAHFKAIYSPYPLYHTLQEKPLSILQIACGKGYFLELAKKAGLDAYGVELNEERAHYMNKELGIPCEATPFSASTFGERKFDLIYHSHLASYLEDSIKSFRTMREKLTEHGQLIFETANGADVDPRYFRYCNHWTRGQRVLFGEDSLRELLTRAGFSRSQFISWSLLPELKFNCFLGRGQDRQGTAGRTIHRVNMAAAKMRYSLRYFMGALSSNRRVPRTILIWAMK